MRENAENVNVTAIILAGGKGKRMNTDIPKQYIDINGKPLIYYTIKAFQESAVDRIVLVTNEREFCERLVKHFNFNKVSMYAAGGRERYDSVMSGLECAVPDTDIVLVHDGARPCVTPSLINKCIEDVAEYGSGVVAVPAKDTIKVVDEKGYVTDTPDRNTLWQIQTPQGFLYKEIAEAYAKLRAAAAGENGDFVKTGRLEAESTESGALYAKSDDAAGLNASLKITDDAMVMEYFGEKRVHITMGEYTNIKVTTAEDLEIAGLWLEPTEPGSGEV